MSDAQITGALSGDYTLDPAHTRLGFVARHALVTKVRGDFADFEGHLHIDAENPSASKAAVTVQMASIDSGNEQRDGHLRTNEFFDIENFPTMTFTSTAIAQTGPVNFDVTGDLTIRGVTQSVTFPLEFTGAATDPFGNARIGFDGGTTIARSDFGITWNAPLETGGVLVSDKITIELDISAIKDAPAESAG